MKKLSALGAGIGLFLLQMVPAHSQNLAQNRVVQKYYSPAALQTLQSSNPARYEWLEILFTASFIVTVVDPSADEPYIPELFDIRPYEQFRKQNERVTITISEKGIQLELLSRGELERMLASRMAANEGGPAAGYPVMGSSGDAARDVQEFIAAVVEWKASHQEAYLQMLSKAENRTVIPRADFDLMPVTRQQLILAQDHLFVVR